MREIKFRAWHNEAEEYCDGTTSNMFMWIEDGQDITIEQYTGLKDKNGVEIYDGDIVECWDSCGFEDTSAFISGVVSFKGGCFCVRHKNGHHNKLALTCAENVEVVGNIHENPELVGAQ